MCYPETGLSRVRSLEISCLKHPQSPNIEYESAVQDLQCDGQHVCLLLVFIHTSVMLHSIDRPMPQQISEHSVPRVDTRQPAQLTRL